MGTANDAAADAKIQRRQVVTAPTTDDQTQQATDQAQQPDASTDLDAEYQKQMADLEAQAPDAVAKIIAGQATLADVAAGASTSFPLIDPESITAFFQQLIDDQAPAADASEGDSEEAAAPEATETTAAADAAPVQESTLWTSLIKRSKVAFEDDMAVVIAIVPKAFKLTLTHDIVLDIKEGTHRMEQFIVNHWYAKNNGVTKAG